MIGTVVSPEAGSPQRDLKQALEGIRVSSLHRLHDTERKEGAFFVFGDMSINLEGVFMLQFNLYDLKGAEATFIKSVVTDPFKVQLAKDWVGLPESTPLTRCFCNQGLRLRVRKEPRSLLGKRGPSSQKYAPHRRSIQGQRLSPAEDKGGTDKALGLLEHQPLGSPTSQREGLEPKYVEPQESYHDLPYGSASMQSPSPPPPLLRRRKSPRSRQSDYLQLPPPQPPPLQEQQEHPLNRGQASFSTAMYPTSQQPYMSGGEQSAHQYPEGYDIYNQPPIHPPSQSRSFSPKKEWDGTFPP
jgi:hypothetical protein